LLQQQNKATATTKIKHNARCNIKKTNTTKKYYLSQQQNKSTATKLARTLATPRPSDQDPEEEEEKEKEEEGSDPEKDPPTSLEAAVVALLSGGIEVTEQERKGGSANRRGRQQAGCERARPSRRAAVSAAARANSECSSELPGHTKTDGNDEASEDSMRSSFFGRRHLS
jgi:hypothetical protein